ncbi:MAG: type II secretion system protein [Verrucomicrobiota bacterium]|nr:type II secretion system protein [Verrucomicrobiota bacterium]
MCFSKSDKNLLMRSGRWGFTLIELLVVISLIGLLAGMMIGLSSLVSSKMRIARIQGELSQLVSAIELYKDRYKVYPPDNQMKDGNGYQVVGSSATNQLVLELTGCLVTNNAFSSPHVRTPSGSLHLLTSAEMKPIFGNAGDGIMNASERDSRVRNFMGSYSQRKLGRLTNANHTLTFDIFRVPVNAPLYQSALDSRGKAWRKMGVNNPWHYNMSEPTNNPGKFDLWAEFQLSRQNMVKQDEQGRFVEYYVIGNWNGMKPEIRKDYF